MPHAAAIRSFAEGSELVKGTPELEWSDSGDARCRSAILAKLRRARGGATDGFALDRIAGL
ncbi:MAG TPA: hypothetical protein VGM07_12365 [Stellaceae bacterium]|jgi:hypothetical protein